MMIPTDREVRNVLLVAGIFLVALLVLVFLAGYGFGQPIPKTTIDRAGIEESSDVVKLGKVEIGEALFNDKVLSSTREHSCATCHIQDKGWTSGGVPMGLDGKPLPRRAPTLFDVGDRRSYFLDGRAATLEKQIEEVMLNEREMGNKSLQDACDRVAKEHGLVLKPSQLIDALASYLRTIKADRGRVGKFMAGDPTADLLTAQERRGYELFRGKANCYRCHPAPNLTDDDFHGTGSGGPFVAGDPRPFDNGRYLVTGKVADAGKLKTPTLWGCSKAGPYMHNASLKTLEDVIEFYDRGGHRYKYIDREMFPLRLSRQEKRDLLTFLRAL